MRQLAATIEAVKSAVGQKTSCRRHTGLILRACHRVRASGSRECAPGDKFRAAR